jgi:tetratricopeptide (TPR) repeat protein
MRLVLAAVAIGVVLGGATAARAQDGKGGKDGKNPKTDKQTREQANRHFKNGVGLFEETKYSEALAEFEAAYTLAPHPLVLYNLAGCHRALSQYDQAVTYYDRFLEAGPGHVKQELLDKARAELDEVLALVAMVVVTTNPVGATVSADGRELGATPLDTALVLGPGDHVIEAALDGYKTARRSLRMSAGDSVRLEIELKLLEEARDSSSATTSIAPAIPDEVVPTVTGVVEPAPTARTIGVSASFGTNAAQLGDTGAPVVGVDYAVASRATIGVDVALVAFAAIPNVRYRLGGDALSFHVLAALPIAFTDGDESDTFVAVAGGAGVRYRATRRIALRVETWVSYAGSDRGTTVPTFAGAELWF